jgi:hypothetical protein
MGSLTTTTLDGKGSYQNISCRQGVSRLFDYKSIYIDDHPSNALYLKLFIWPNVVTMQIASPLSSSKTNVKVYALPLGKPAIRKGWWWTLLPVRLVKVGYGTIDL